MDNSPPKTAKEKILKWIRDAVPQKFEHCISFETEEQIKICDMCGEKYPKGECPTMVDALEINLQELLIAVMKNGVKIKYGDWQTRGTSDGFLCFYSENGDALGNYNLHKSLEDNLDNPELVSFLLPLIND